MRTEVAIVGAGPAGLLLSHLLASEGIDSVVIETRSREYVEARIRAGILESSTVALLDAAGLGERVHREGLAPSTDQLIYAWHPDGFALHSMRSPAVSRLYLQVEPDTDIADWPDDRIWDALATRLGHGQDGWALTPGPITEKSVLPFRSYVMAPMRYGRLFLAGDAAHTVPPTGAKGLNLAVADVAALAPALTAMLRKNSTALADAYSDTVLRRVWRYTHFSWWMTTMLHTTGDPFDAQLQLSQLRWITTSTAGATGLAENYAGLPIGS